MYFPKIWVLEKEYLQNHFFLVGYYCFIVLQFDSFFSSRLTMICQGLEHSVGLHLALEEDTVSQLSSSSLIHQSTAGGKPSPSLAAQLCFHYPLFLCQKSKKNESENPLNPTLLSNSANLVS